MGGRQGGIKGRNGTRDERTEVEGKEKGMKMTWRGGSGTGSGMSVVRMND